MLPDPTIVMFFGWHIDVHQSCLPEPISCMSHIVILGYKHQHQASYAALMGHQASCASLLMGQQASYPY
jgi:hypothetical protein